MLKLQLFIDIVLLSLHIIQADDTK